MENRFLHKFKNIIVLSVKTRNIDKFLTNLYKLNIDIFKVDVIKYNEVIVEIYESDYLKVKKLSILNKIEIIDFKGNKKRIERFSYNKILFVSLIIGICLLYLLSNIIFSIEINHSSKEIREFIRSELNINGINELQLKKGYIELEKIKNKILEDNKDKLEWLEIVNVGTKYIVKVEERKINNISNDYKYQDIVSLNDAVIKKIIAKSGVKVKEVNEYVKKGDTIISGSIYLNEELKKNVKALGEIYGEVWYKLNVEYPIVNVSKEKTGNKKNVLSLNLFNKNYILYGKNDYKNSYKAQKYLLKNNILPISLSIDTLYEQESTSGIYTEGEALLNARYYGREKINNMLEKDEYIISDKVLNYRVNRNTIYMSVFFKVYKNITGTREIIIEEGG